MACGAIPPKFVFEDTRHRDYRSIREGLIRRGWQQEALSRQQQVCPEVRSARDAKYSSPGQRGGAATGTASTSHKIVSCPDLIWTLSLKHSPVLRTLGPQQATNFFGATSSCLTTKVRLHSMGGESSYVHDTRHFASDKQTMYQGVRIRPGRPNPPREVHFPFVSTVQSSIDALMCDLRSNVARRDLRTLLSTTYCATGCSRVSGPFDGKNTKLVFSFALQCIMHMWGKVVREEFILHPPPVIFVLCFAFPFIRGGKLH